MPWFTDGVPVKIKELDHQQKHSVEKEIQQAVTETELQARERLEDQIAGYVARIFTKALVGAMQDPALSGLLEPTAPIAPVLRRLAHPSRVKLRRVIVAGMLNSQAKTIEAAFKDKLDLRFWSKDQSADTLKSMLSHADAAIGMVGFLSHSHDAVLKSSKVTYVPVSGGVTQVKQALERLLETA